MDVVPPATAVVVAGDEEIRILLRGLLRLHHFRVLGEASEESEGLELVRSGSPRLLVVDSRLNGGSVGSLLASARRIAPHVRTVLVASQEVGPAPSEVAPDAMLPRPFRVRDFAEAVGVSGDGPK
jgi:DNA-binding NarL/FixJ family response regulator